jgi:hypothetical protein
MVGDYCIKQVSRSAGSDRAFLDNGASSRKNVDKNIFIDLQITRPK